MGPGGAGRTMAVEDVADGEGEEDDADAVWRSASIPLSFM